MKRTLSLWMGLLAFALLPAFSQAPEPTGKVHGHVTNPTGAPQAGGTVTLVATTRLASGPGLTAQTAEKGVFKVDANGDFAGEAPAGTFDAIYRTEGMTPDKNADKMDSIKVVVGQDTAVDFDMSRKEYIDKLPPDQQKQLEDLKSKNSVALKANEVIKNLNADLKTVNQDIKDADGAKAAAAAQLGASATKPDLEAKETEIKTSKFTEISTLMEKDTSMRPTESILWADLGLGQAGLKKYDDAETSYKKALDLESTSKKPRPEVSGMANAGLGEIYARTGKVPDANAAYNAAAKADPTKAGFYLTNEAKIFFQANNSDAQVAAANEALKADPTQSVLYYIIGNGLVQKATVDNKTGKITAPPGCLEAYQKYLELAPDGPYAGEVKDILTGFGQKINSSYKAAKK